jgi:ribosomal protein L17
MYSNNVSQRKSTVENLDSALSWDDAISFAKAKIKELNRAIEGFEMAKKRGDLWPTTKDAI